MQRAHSSYICVGHRDKEMEEHATITSPSVGELITICMKGNFAIAIWETRLFVVMMKYKCFLFNSIVYPLVYSAMPI